MKFSGQNSFALSPDALARAGESKPGAQLLDVMKKLGKKSAFEKLIHEHLDPSSKLAYRLTGNWDLAEELVQETMLRAVTHWESFREQAQFKTWLYRILFNAYRDQFRNRSKLRISEESVEVESREQAVDSQAEAVELSKIVSRLIGQLPDRQQEVLILSSYEALTNQQIACTLSITVANVHSNLSAARKRLKQQLATYLGP